MNGIIAICEMTLLSSLVHRHSTKIPPPPSLLAAGTMKVWFSLACHI